MEIKQVKITDLKFAEYNPRKITEKQVEDLKKSIQDFGVVEPVVVNCNPERMNTIVGGHMRVRILSMLGFTEVPVVYVDLTLEREKELNIRLNKNTGSFDFDILANQFKEDDLINWGFTQAELGIGDYGKDEIDRDNLADTMNSYLAGNIKQVVLYFDNNEFENVMAFLEKFMADHGLKSHTECFMRLKQLYESQEYVVAENNENTGTQK